MTITRSAVIVAALAVAAASVSAEEPEAIPYKLDREPSFVMVYPLLETSWGPMGVTNVTDAAVGPEYPCYNLYTSNNLTPGHMSVEMAQIARYFRWPRPDTKRESLFGTVDYRVAFLRDLDGDGVYDAIRSNAIYRVSTGSALYRWPPPPPPPGEEPEPQPEQGFRNYDWDLMTARPQVTGVAETNRYAIGRLCYDCMAALGTRASLRQAEFHDDVTLERVDFGGVAGTGGFVESSSVGYMSSLMSIFGFYNVLSFDDNSSSTASRKIYRMYDQGVQHRLIHANLIGSLPVQLRFQLTDMEMIDPSLWRPDVVADPRVGINPLLPTSTNKTWTVLCDGYGYEGTNEYVHLNFTEHGDKDGWYNLAAMTNADIVITDNFLKYRLGPLVGACYNTQPWEYPELLDGLPNYMAGEVVRPADDGTCEFLGGANAQVNVLLRDAGQMYLEIDDIHLSDFGGYLFAMPTNGIPDMTLRAVYRDPVSREYFVAETNAVLSALDMRSATAISDVKKIGNAWYRLSVEPARALVNDRDPYLSLEYAMIKAERSEIRPAQLKVCREIEFASVDWSLVSNVVISCTNEHPEAAMVVRSAPGRLICADGAEITFSNLVFQAQGADKPSVEVTPGARVSLAGTVDFGCVKLQPGACLNIATAPEDLERSFEIDQEGGNVEGELFATSSIPVAVASTFANRYVNARDDLLVGIASVNADGITEFRWGYGEVPDCAATVRLYQGEEGEYVNYRLLSRAFAAIEGDAEMEVVRDCVFSNQVTLAHSLRIYGSEGVTPRIDIPGIKVSDSFTVPADTSLTFENVVLSGHVGEELFKVEGGELTFGDGAVVSNCAYRTSAQVKRALTTVTSGTLRFASGSLVSDCRNEQGPGGFAQLLGDSSAVEFAGGTVTGCVSKGRGGAVYVDKGAEVTASGPACVFGNVYRQNDNLYVEDDIYFLSTNRLLEVSGDLTGGRFGVFYQLPKKQSYSEVPLDRCATNSVFAVVTAALSEEELQHTGATMENLRYLGTLRGKATEAGDELYWEPVPIPPDHEPLPPEQWDEEWARIQVDYEDGAVERWEHADWAINQLAGRPATVTFMKDDIFTEPVTFGGGTVTLTADAGAGSVTWLRGEPVRIDIGAEGVFAVSNLTIDAGGSGALFYVNGGELDLTGVTIGGVRGSADRAQGAITVYNGGICQIDGLTRITDCQNSYVNVVEGTGVGGGILVDKGRLYLHGEVTVDSNRAYKSGGIFLGNSGELFLGEGVKVKGNVNNIDGEEGNLTYHYMCAMQLDSPLSATADVCCNPGVGGSTNIFCAVSDDYPGDLASLVASAERFTRDRTGSKVHAVVVTNLEGKAFFAWADCMTADRPSCVGRDQQTYYYAAGTIYEPDDPPPPPPPVEPTAIAFTSIELADGQVVLKFTNGVTSCRYFLYATNSLDGGFEVPSDGSGAISEFTASADGEQTFSVPVTDEVIRFFKALALPAAQE